MISHALLVLLAAGPMFEVAEVEPSPAGAAVMAEVDAKAVVFERTPRVALWRVSVDVLARLEAKLPGHFAAVIHDGPKTRVAAGGVMVWLAPGVNPELWASLRRVNVKQNFGSGTLLLESAPGTSSLALAAALQSDKRVVRAAPNWWLRAHRR